MKVVEPESVHFLPKEVIQIRPYPALSDPNRFISGKIAAMVYNPDEQNKKII